MSLFLDDGDVRLYAGDALEQLRLMPSESVHCIVTSPPFWGLRDYNEPRQIGLEETPDEWCTRLVTVFREARRVLRNDGVCWIECGDTYASGSSGTGGTGASGLMRDGRDESGRQSADAANGRAKFESRAFDLPAAGLKPKDLVGAPWLLAFALRADGWYLRSDTIWARPNPMPESVTDRPTKSHSYVFLITKSARYFYDADAIREESQVNPDNGWAKGEVTVRSYTGEDHPSLAKQTGGAAYTPSTGTHRLAPLGAGRNARSVWNIPTEPTPYAHFATFPTALVERCIKAGTSEHGACSECGAPWRRITNVEGATTTDRRKDNGYAGTRGADDTTKVRQNLDYGGHHGSNHRARETLGWEASCDHGCPCGHDAEAHATPGTECSESGCDCAHAPYIVPCVVLDPFIGSGTTALVARRLGRHAIGIELNLEYLAIAAKRLEQLSLFSTEPAPRGCDPGPE